MAVLETILFLWMSPGVVFTFPPIDGRWFSTDTTSWQAILTHAALFAGILAIIKGPSRTRQEGFQVSPSPVPPPALKMGSAVRRRLEERKAALETL